MKCDLSHSGDILFATTSGPVGPNERNDILHQIVEAYEANDPNIILVDHRLSKLDCSMVEAVEFGELIGDKFSANKPCFIAILANPKDPSLKLIDISIMVAALSERQIFIESYFEEQLAVNAITCWRDSAQNMIDSQFVQQGSVVNSFKVP